MTKFLFSAAVIALIGAAPASAQILGGGGPVGGLGGGLGGTIGTTIERGGRTTIDSATRASGNARVDRSIRNRRATADATLDNATRLGERRVVTTQAARFDSMPLDQRLQRTRGAVAARARGLRQVESTASGVQVFVPRVAITGPTLPSPTVVAAYPAYGSSYYYGPNAVFVDYRQVDHYMDRHYQDLEASLRGTGAQVSRRGSDLIVMLPGDITFAFDKSDIRPRFYGVLSAFADTMRRYPGTDVEILGHTDSVGSDAYNLKLSERRGRAVADFLVARSAEPARLVVEAMGEADPIDTNATAQGRAANRRVELVVHPRGG